MGIRIGLLALAVSSIAAGPVLADEMSDLKTYCKADIERLCGVESEGVGGVICGRAIYTGALDFAQAQRRADELNGGA